LNSVLVLFVKRTGVNILTLNPGSSTLKYASFSLSQSAGPLPGVPPANGILARGSLETGERSRTIEEIVAIARSRGTIDAVGCRVVHGGLRFSKPERVTSGMLDELRGLEDLAPLHNPVDVGVLEQLLNVLPDVPLIAAFDTSFHQTLPEVAFTYALPSDLSRRHGLRRYGFHGLSHAYVSRQLMRWACPEAAESRLIVCHLGNGASVCALRDGKSMDVSMGFTPMEGLVMGTRSGDVDPGLVLYLIRSAGMSADQVSSLLNHDSGLRGISGTSGDVRTLEAAALRGDKSAELALSVFAYRVRKYIGSFAAVLGGIDAVAFTGGIGEHSPSMRSRICGGLQFLGIDVDDQRNLEVRGGEGAIITGNGSRVQAWVIPTDEEWEIARSVYALLGV
jgi:acetate kinase